MEAMVALRLRKGRVLTYAQEETRKIEDRAISIYPVWKWLLNGKAQ